MKASQRSGALAKGRTVQTVGCVVGIDDVIAIDWAIGWSSSVHADGGSMYSQATANEHSRESCSV